MSNEKKTPAAKTDSTAEDNKKIRFNPQQLRQLYQSERKKVVSVRRRAQSMEGILLETIGAKLMLEEIKNGKGTEVMVPLGAGYFMSTTRKTDASLLKSMAGNVMIPMTASEGIEEATKNEENIRKQLATLQNEEQGLMANISQIENAMSLMAQQQQMAKSKAKTETPTQ